MSIATLVIAMVLKAVMPVMLFVSCLIVCCEIHDWIKDRQQ